LLVLIALLGLLAMHGLSAHGAAPAGAATQAGAAHAHADHPTSPADDDARAGTGGAEPGHHHLALMGLCLAVLAGALAAWSLLRRRLGVGWTPAVAIAPVRAPGARRLHGPPCLHLLSIQRC